MSYSELRKVVSTLLMGHLSVDVAMSFIETDRLAFGIDTEIVMYRNLPFYKVDGLGMIPLLPRFYGVYANLYQDVVLASPNEPTPFVKYPLIDTSIIDWPGFIRKANKASHFFGAKSQTVAWSWEPITQELGEATYDLAWQHYQSFAGRHDSKEYELYFPWWLHYSRCNGYAVVARCGEEIVALMYCVPIFDVLHCKMMAITHDEKYKPFSLAMCAHLMAVKCAADNDYGLVDLGMNDGDVGDYKMSIPGVVVPKIHTLTI